MNVEAVIETRRMSRQELDQAVELAASEGWNPGLHDADCFYEADPAGFFVAMADGEPVGSVSAVAYDDKFGFAGFFIVKKEWRENGIGHLLAGAALEHLGSRNTGIDAVVDMQEKYESIGFELAYSSARFRGIARDTAADHGSLVPLSELDFEALAGFDNRFFPAKRDRFLRCWIDMADSLGLASVRDGKIVGYGVLRKCGTGHKFGPLFAESVATAQTLFDALAASVKGGKIFLDVPLPNSDAVELAVARGMSVVFETGRMYNGGTPDLPIDKIFGITSFELG